MAHRITYTELSGQRGQYGQTRVSARCACGVTFKGGSWQESEEWEMAHRANIERTKSYLGTKNPSLKGQYDYFRSREEGEDDTHKKGLWKQLADELERRLGKPITEEDQPALPI